KEIYYKETEYLLYNYKMLEISIENIKKEIELLEEESGVGGINYEGVSTSSTNKFHSVTENTALAISEEVSFREHEIRRIKERLDSVDRAIEGLTDIERDIVTKK